MIGLRRRLPELSQVIITACMVLLFAGLAPHAEAQVGDDESRRLVASAEKITGDSFPVSIRTPRGVRVFARREPLADTLRAIDEGLTELFSIARRHGYRARLNHSDYTMFIARADRTRDSVNAYSPDIAVPAAQYAGSYYDQGGFIYAAGMIVAFQPCAFVIAEHDQDLWRVSNVVRYEGEHLVLYHNDRALYERTADHSKGGGHPILQ